MATDAPMPGAPASQSSPAAAVPVARIEVLAEMAATLCAWMRTHTDGALAGDRDALCAGIEELGRDVHVTRRDDESALAHQCRRFLCAAMLSAFIARAQGEELDACYTRFVLASCVADTTA